MSNWNHDSVPATGVDVPPAVAMAAMATLRRHDALDLAPMLFAPLGAAVGRDVRKAQSRERVQARRTAT